MIFTALTIDFSRLLFTSKSLFSSFLILVPSPTYPLATSNNMEIQSSEKLVKKKCVPCEGGVEACPLPKVTAQLKELNEGWYLSSKSQRIRKDWTVKNFMAGMNFFNKVAVVAEEEGHHPGAYIVCQTIAVSISAIDLVLK
jgi:4a-hydroxytetrahydrobiopterin dehydratase